MCDQVTLEMPFILNGTSSHTGWHSRQKLHVATWHDRAQNCVACYTILDCSRVNKTLVGVAETLEGVLDRGGQVPNNNLNDPVGVRT